ncbi:Integrase SAM-like N-terminal domain-containing protein [Parendozoicomonas haliclonae]|uniref:Uncharacterized protein n=1 Tax=Parendozoicomonas haliclonae TaxID=1960125 RepID=A0A1X7ANI0_9GAMM|nr:hypothetical protein EHSB41UT_03636 [Parendozoicomonas haliclonae]
MSKPKLNHMVAYLQGIGVRLGHLTQHQIEAEYFRRIYQVQSRSQALSQTQRKPCRA